MVMQKDIISGTDEQPPHSDTSFFLRKHVQYLEFLLLNFPKTIIGIKCEVHLISLIFLLLYNILYTCSM